MAASTSRRPNASSARLSRKPLRTITCATSSSGQSEKFHHPGTVPLNVKGHPRLVITDKNIPPDCKAQLERDGIDVLLANADA